MRWTPPSSFRAQIIIIAAASLAIVALAALIVRDVVFTTESKLLGDAQRQCITAVRELRLQYQERAAYAGNPLYELPAHAQEISLRGISTTVLQAFQGIQGGMYLASQDRFMGYTNPAEPAETSPRLTEPEKDFIRSLASRTGATGEIATQSEWWNRDLVVGAAMLSDEMIVWTMQRVPVLRYPLSGSNHWWLAALVFSAILGVVGIVSIWFILRSGIMSIQSGLRILQDDFSYRLPSIHGDLGQVALAINRMAERRMMLEEQLRLQDRLAALGKVVSGVAHEVRNPLNSIKLTLQLLERRLKKGIVISSEVQECLQEIDRLDMIVGRLLAFGRSEMNNRHIQDVSSLVKQAIKMVNEPLQKKEIVLDTAGVENGLAADVDGPQIIQVLINLLLNAIEASPHEDRVIVTMGNAASNIWINIADNGPRIPDEVRPHLFDAYYTTKPDGSGLGLAVSREIIANHGGRLEFESENSGTSFTIHLPMKRNTPDET
jgi:signal transduction histidine kinase